MFLYDTAGQERFADMAASYYRIGQVSGVHKGWFSKGGFRNTSTLIRHTIAKPPFTKPPFCELPEVCLLCFDMSNLASFDNTKWWMRNRDHTNHPHPHLQTCSSFEVINYITI